MANLNERLLIICVGNAARGDDAAGPLVAEQLLAQQPTLPVLETFQLQPELVDDLAGHDCILIIDAHTNIESPLTLRRITPAESLGWCSHALSPEQLAGLYVTAFRQSPPEIIAIGIRGEQFELGAIPTPAVMALTMAVTSAVLCLHRDVGTASSPVDRLAFLVDALAQPPEFTSHTAPSTAAEWACATPPAGGTPHA